MTNREKTLFRRLQEAEAQRDHLNTIVYTMRDIIRASVFVLSQPEFAEAIKSYFPRVIPGTKQHTILEEAMKQQTGALLNRLEEENGLKPPSSEEIAAAREVIVNGTEEDLDDPDLTDQECK